MLSNLFIREEAIEAEPMARNKDGVGSNEGGSWVITDWNGQVCDVWQNAKLRNGARIAQEVLVTFG